MLKNLLIKNYTLIEYLEIQPSQGLNIITGETGAGKSIMVGAVGLLLGNRADTTVLYNKNQKCVVEGTFDLSSFDLKDIFTKKELDYEQYCLIRREISPSGKSRAFINDTPVALNTVKSITLFLMDIHSQHDTLLLASNSYQLNILDYYAQLTPQLEIYKSEFHAYQQAKKKWSLLTQNANSLRQEADYNHYLLQELDEAQLDALDLQKLDLELKQLENAGDIQLRISEALKLLSSEEVSAYSLLYQAQIFLNPLNSFSKSFLSLFQRLKSCSVELGDIIKEFEYEQDRVVTDPEKTELIKQQVNQIHSLLQKHKCLHISQLTKIRDDLREKTYLMEHINEDLLSSQVEIDARYKTVANHGKELHDKRLALKEELAHKISSLLKEVGIRDANIDILLSEKEPDITGFDEVEILFSANKGIMPAKIRKTASGGEFSRLMFCIKYLLAENITLPTIIFDEIESGISGEVALQMAKMMKKMSEKHQVISISHLPQIAAKGDHHYFVFKDSSSSKSMSKIKLLAGDERVNELAKMIGGNQASQAAYNSAQDMLNN